MVFPVSRAIVSASGLRDLTRAMSAPTNGIHPSVVLAPIIPSSSGPLSSATKAYRLSILGITAFLKGRGLTPITVKAPQGVALCNWFSHVYWLALPVWVTLVLWLAHLLWVSLLPWLAQDTWVTRFFWLAPDVWVSLIPWPALYFWFSLSSPGLSIISHGPINDLCSNISIA